MPRGPSSGNLGRLVVDPIRAYGVEQVHVGRDQAHLMPVLVFRLRVVLGWWPVC
jgi:hypothetical protein